jgi:hypothetical protein
VTDDTEVIARRAAETSQFVSRGSNEPL